MLDVGGLKAGDVAGLGLLNLPYAWIGVRAKEGGAMEIEQFNQLTGETRRAALTSKRVWLRVSCDFLTEAATFAHSVDGERFEPIGGAFEMIFQLKTFQGVRYSLFAFNDAGKPGGAADFDSFVVNELNPRGLMRPIPIGQTITLTARGTGLALGVKDRVLAAVPEKDASRFTVIDVGLGRVGLRADDGRWISASSEGVSLMSSGVDAARQYQWTESVYGDLILMSLTTHRHLLINPESGAISADHPGPAPDRRDGSCFDWKIQAP
jgi:hypothetical protein